MQQFRFVVLCFRTDGSVHFCWYNWWIYFLWCQMSGTQDECYQWSCFFFSKITYAADIFMTSSYLIPCMDLRPALPCCLCDTCSYYIITYIYITWVLPEKNLTWHTKDLPEMLPCPTTLRFLYILHLEIIQWLSPALSRLFLTASPLWHPQHVSEFSYSEVLILFIVNTCPIC